MKQESSPQSFVRNVRIMFRCDIPEYHWQGIERVYALVGWHFLLKDDSVRYPIFVIEKIIEVPNSAFYPSDAFRITKKDLMFVSTLIQQDDEIVGFMHSHPPKQYRPSDADIQGVGKGLIGAVQCDDRIVWFSENGIFEPLLITDY